MSRHEILKYKADKTVNISSQAFVKNKNINFDFWCAAQKKYSSLQLLSRAFTSSAVRNSGEEENPFHHEENNAFDVYVIKTVTESNQIVCHLSKGISWITKLLLNRGAKISLTLTCTTLREEKIAKEENAEENKCGIKECEYWPNSHSLIPHFPVRNSNSDSFLPHFQL